MHIGNDIYDNIGNGESRKISVNGDPQMRGKSRSPRSYLQIQLTARTLKLPFLPTRQPNRRNAKSAVSPTSSPRRLTAPAVLPLHSTDLIPCGQTDDSLRQIRTGPREGEEVAEQSSATNGRAPCHFDNLVPLRPGEPFFPGGDLLD
ncbi:hypothetical protein GWI33_016937 [Rhynchophorus ferrugineus]|uniref:Uncharacterized protein n=1 Tax=Rhynchophorus ferrugineus TaxID=354439 RepID=A0A834HZ59_RHYFE|nr:hypothetical protein GWI33_016937 [Rhynchophorus ferrugineus]